MAACSVFNLEFASSPPHASAAALELLRHAAQRQIDAARRADARGWLYTLYSLSRKARLEGEEAPRGQATPRSSSTRASCRACSSTIAETFVCDRLGDEQFLRADLTIACDGSEEPSMSSSRRTLSCNLHESVPRALRWRNLRRVRVQRPGDQHQAQAADNYGSVEVDGATACDSAARRLRRDQAAAASSRRGAALTARSTAMSCGIHRHSLGVHSAARASSCTLGRTCRTNLNLLD